MSKLVVAVKSCHRDRDAGFHDAIRQTWAQDLKAKGVDTVFFLGRTTDPRRAYNYAKDEVVVDAVDDYMSLPAKTRGITAWMNGKAVDQLFLCDNDTIIFPDRLLELPYLGLDYGGFYCSGAGEIKRRFDYKDHMGFYPQSYAWCSGGGGYFLSRRSAALVAATYPTVWAEDMYVGQVVGPDICSGMFRSASFPTLNNGPTTYHFKKSRAHPRFTPQLLHRIYAEGGPASVYAER